MGGAWDHMGWNGSAGRITEVAGSRRLSAQGKREKGKASIIDLDLTLNDF
jgi:hypothetical protein